MGLAIESEGLGKRFGRVWAVSDVGLSAPRGAVYGVLGPNGAGKTTTIRMILGLLRPTAGWVRVEGVDVARDRLRAARHVGALLEAHALYANLTGRENLRITASLLGLPLKEIERVLALVEMSEAADRRVGGYSLGMRQRLGVARALLGRPSLLVMDEPTNGLDPEGIAAMRELLRDLPARAGATVFLSSHLLAEVDQIASHVGVIHQGRLVAQGALADLKAAVPAMIEVDCDRPDAARALLSAHGLAADAAEGGVVLAVAPDDEAAVAAAANRLLVQAGFSVARLAPRPRSLDAVYGAARRAALAAAPRKEAA